MKNIMLGLLLGVSLWGFPSAAPAEVYWAEEQAIPVVPQRYVDLLYSPVTAGRKIGARQRQGEPDPKVQIGHWLFAYYYHEDYIYGITEEYNWEYDKAICLYRQREGSRGYDIYYRFYRRDQTYTMMHLSIGSGDTPNFFATGADAPDPGSKITREMDQLAQQFLGYQATTTHR